MKMTNQTKSTILKNVITDFQGTIKYYSTIIDDFESPYEGSEIIRKNAKERIKVSYNLYNLLIDAFESLKFEERRILYLKYIGRKTHKEICFELSISRSTYNRILTKALSDLVIPPEIINFYTERTNEDEDSNN